MSVSVESGVLLQRTRKTRRAAVGVGTALALVSSGLAAQGAVAAPARHLVGGSIPTWRPQATLLGTTSKTASVNFDVLLKGRDQAGEIAKIQAISNPHSASYGKWLTHAQFVSAYAPAASSVSAVTSWLDAQGVSVRGSLAGGAVLEVSASAATVNKTFGTSLQNFAYKNQMVHTNTSALSVGTDTPAAVLSALSGVVGLDQGSAMKKPANAVFPPTNGLPGPPPGSKTGVPPCSKYYGEQVATTFPAAYGEQAPYAVCGYIPSQYQGAYGESSLISKGTNGKGVTIAITDAYASPTMLADAQTYNRQHNVPLFKAIPVANIGQYSEIRPSSFNVYDPADAQGWYGEETLDVEAAHGMAPGANIVYVAGSDDLGGLDEAWAETIDNHVADIITNSWSYGSDDVDDVTSDFYTYFAMEAAATGITDNFSTGDDGDGTSGGTDPAGLAVGFPSDNPYVTGVGGTSVLINKSNQWVGEYGWSNAYAQFNGTSYDPAPPGTFSSGGGGGTSTLYAQPPYQKGVVPTSISEANGSTPMRTIPDISMPGDPNTGFLVGETQDFGGALGKRYSEYRIGGTSLSSPLLAGVIAVADQVAGHPLGFVNPLYYALNGSSALHDLSKPTTPVAQLRTNYTNGVDATCGRSYVLQTIDALSGTLKDTKGYDNETGVGTPNGPTFFSALAQLASN